MQGEKGKLKRLVAEHYRGRACVFWTHTTEHRAPLPLSAEFHARFREIMTHASARYGLACPAYCLMPDHLHLLWIGLSEISDQKLASSFLRRQLSPMLGSSSWQRQAYDHVLRDEERKRNNFAATVEYIFENPVRKQLAAVWHEYPYHGAVVAGYPDLKPRDPKFQEKFWRIFEGLCH